MNPTIRNVVFVIDDLTFGGAQKQLTLLVRALPVNWRATVVSMSSDTEPFARLLEEQGVRLVVLERRSGFDVARLWKLIRLINEIQPDIVHGFLDAANAYAFLAARAVRKPVVLSLRNERLCVTGVHARILTWMFQRSERVLVNSKAGEDFLSNVLGVRRERVVFVHNWFAPISNNSAPTRKQAATRTIGFVGRFEEQKRLHLLIDAFRQVASEMPEAKLILMGTGSLRASLDRQINDAGLTAQVTFVEPNLNIDGTLQQLDCFVLPSAFEGTPNAAVEALALGIPLIASPVGDVCDLIIEGSTGTVFEGNDPSVLAQKIIGVLTNPNLQQKAKTEGPLLVKRAYSVASALDTLLPMYDRLAPVRAE